MFRLALIPLFVVGATAAAEMEYTITDLGTLGGDSSRASDVNESGQVVGTSEFSPGSSFQHAFLWLPVMDYGLSAGMHDLGTFGGSRSSASALNDLGQVVGRSDDVSGNDRALLWLPSSAHGLPAGSNDIGTLGGISAGALGINGNGQIVGWATDDPFPFAPGHAFLWKSGTMTDLGTLANRPFRTAHDVNESGQVVGEVGDDTPPSELAFLWLRQPAYGFPAGIHDLGLLPGTVQEAGAAAINDHGQVAGWAGIDFTETRAMLWLPDPAYGLPAGMNDLGTLGGSRARAHDVNNAGVVVGASLIPSPGGDRAFVWRDGVMSNLNDLHNSDSGWILEEATGVNELGQISGFGEVAGETHAFLLTPLPPPECESLCLFLVDDLLQWLGGPVLDTIQYDVAHGDLSTLHDTNGDFTQSTLPCVFNDLPGTEAVFTEDPPAGSGFWFVVRTVLPAGIGTYDEPSGSQVGSRDAGIDAAVSSCP